MTAVAEIVILIIVIVLFVCIYVPLGIYHGIKYYQKRNHTVYRSRYSNITLYEIKFLLSYFIYSVFTLIITFITPLSGVARESIYFFAYLLLYLIMYVWVWRFWMISYTLIWTNDIMNNEWMTVINSINTANTSWYVLNKHTYGNYIWVKWKLLFIAIISAIIHSGSSFVGTMLYGEHSSKGNFTELFFSWPYVIPILILIIIYWKTPTFNDNFYVSKEIKYIFIILLVQYISYYSLCFIRGIIIQQYNATYRILVLIQIAVSGASQFAGLLISTLWVNKKVDSIINDHQFKQITIQSDNVQLLEINASRTDNNVGQDVGDGIQLIDIFGHQTALNEFMKHLSLEFSTECLLAVIEFFQYQKLAKYELNVHMDEKEQELLCDRIYFTDCVPESDIVCNNEDSLKEKAFNLYKKYAAIGSKYEINISYYQRNKLTNLMNDYEEWIANDGISNHEMLNIFSSSCDEMIRLMQDSFRRFKRTGQYHKLSKNLIFV
eukprot:127175_1